MTKKKDKIVIPETPVEKIQPDPISLDPSLKAGVESGALYPITQEQWLHGGTLAFSPEDGVYIGINPNYKTTFHAIFTPTWRPEIDCGDHDSIEDAKTAIERTAAEYHRTPFLAWRRESPLLWLASGHDGEVDTNMTIATITQVSAS